MNRPKILTDDAIRAALTLDPGVQAPSELSTSIRAAIDSTTQRRRWPSWASPQVESTLRLVVVGLLLLALLGAIFLLGSRGPSPIVLPAVVTFHGGPARTGVMAGPGPQGNLSQCWPAAALAGPVGSYAPVVSDGTVYVGDASGVITAVAEASGVVLWQSPPGSPINDAPTIASGLVIAGSDDGFVTARDTLTGHERWQVRTSGPVRSSPVAVDGVLYFGSDDGHVYAYDAVDGAHRWTSPDTGGPIDRAIAISDGVIYAGSGSPTDATFDAFDSATGKPRWAGPTHLGPGQPSTPSVADGQVYVASGLDTAAAPHLLFGLDAASGRELWRWSSPNGPKQQINIGAVAGGTIYVVSYDHDVYALDTANGHARWDRAFATKGLISAVGGLVDGTLYVPSSDRRIYSIDASDGQQRWAPVAIPGDPSGPAIVDGRLFVATTLGKLVCIQGSAASSP
jgi:eukaryotic-like serine/threonine-protein kinase